MSSSCNFLDFLFVSDRYKVRLKFSGKHVHLTVFSRAHHSGDSYANCGTLCFDYDELHSRFATQLSHDQLACWDLRVDFEIQGGDRLAHRI